MPSQKMMIRYLSDNPAGIKSNEKLSLVLRLEIRSVNRDLQIFSSPSFGAFSRTLISL